MPSHPSLIFWCLSSCTIYPLLSPPSSPPVFRLRVTCAYMSHKSARTLNLGTFTPPMHLSPHSPTTFPHTCIYIYSLQAHLYPRAYSYPYSPIHLSQRHRERHTHIHTKHQGRMALRAKSIADILQARKLATTLQARLQSHTAKCVHHPGDRQMACPGHIHDGELYQHLLKDE